LKKSFPVKRKLKKFVKQAFYDHFTAAISTICYDGPKLVEMERLFMDYLSLCLICKDENDYLPEWLDYHILMGVDRFYIYDNESQISLRESLADYISRGWVVVTEIPGKAVQLFAYDHCIHTFGNCTFWMGFIDTDEFLVPKNTLDLKEILREYEDFAGLAVSSLFFGSNGLKERPIAGQIAGYTTCTHPTFQENTLIKTIVRPSQIVAPNSPHDFIYKEKQWCVNEGKLRVDYQRFPNHIDEIQLNHYFCRSENEIEQKLKRGRGAKDSAWPKHRFDTVNQWSTYPEKTVLQNLAHLFKIEGVELDGIEDIHSRNLIDKMAFLAKKKPSKPADYSPSSVNNFREEIILLKEIKTKISTAEEQKDYLEINSLILQLVKAFPTKVTYYVDLSINLIHLKEMDAAWQAMAYAWSTAPNTYYVLSGMTYYFLRAKNYEMADKTAHLLIDLAPNDLTALAYMTEALLGQKRFEEAIHVGVPMIKLAEVFGELPDQMGIYLIREMSSYLQRKRDYITVAQLWEAGMKIQSGDIDVIIEYVQALIHIKDKSHAQQWLLQAEQLDPQNKSVISLKQQLGIGPKSLSSKKRR
jgi:tetratricopeptide (TPR) repeat protein